MPDSIEMADRWLRASGIPVTNAEIRAWLDDRGIPVMVFVQQLFAAIRQAVIEAGDAGYIEGCRQAAEALRTYARNYPANVFPPDSDSRDAIGGTAMRHAYNNAARIAEGTTTVSGSSPRAQAAEPCCEHCGGELLRLVPAALVSMQTCRDCGRLAAPQPRPERPVDLWLGPPRRDMVRLADLDLQQDGGSG